MKSARSLVAALILLPAACDRGDPAAAPAAQPPPQREQAVATQAPADPPAPGFRELTVEEVAAKIGRPGVYLLDNNNEDEWVAGHVPTATWVDYKSYAASELPADKSATLIFYCHNEH